MLLCFLGVYMCLLQFPLLSLSLCGFDACFKDCCVVCVFVFFCIGQCVSCCRVFYNDDVVGAVPISS